MSEDAASDSEYSEEQFKEIARLAKKVSGGNNRLENLFDFKKWHATHKDNISKFVEYLYPDTTELYGFWVVKAYLKSGKFGFIGLDDSFFIIITADEQKSLPGPHGICLISLYKENEVKFKDVYKPSLAIAIDDIIFELVFLQYMGPDFDYDNL